MASALIGHTGFVGGNLKAQHSFDFHFNSSNIADIRGQSFDLVVCAGINAVKYLANKEPEADWQRIEGLLTHLETVQAKRFFLISTVDVYPPPVAGDESSPIVPGHPYGLHRYRVEEWAAKRFPATYVMRLPGLFGDGLKKNVIFDLMHNRQDMMETMNPDCRFQYYCLDRVWADAERQMEKNISVLNVATEPVSTGEIVSRFFPQAVIGQKAGGVIVYDFRTIHDAAWGGSGGYLYSKEQVLGDLGAWLSRQSLSA
jgi:nucleoside-diphosphate-sugar epimerase